MMVLDEADCRLRLRSRTLGRVAVKLADDLVILPVYYAVMDDDIVFRTAPGTKLSAAVLGTTIAFEVDGAAPAWSVLVRGHAQEIRDHETQVRATRAPRQRLAGRRTRPPRAGSRREDHRSLAAAAALTRPRRRPRLSR